MELHNDEVPGAEVWVVVVESAYSQQIEWFLTSSAASEDYRILSAWYEGKQNRGNLSAETKVARMHLTLPRQRMEWHDVDVFVRAALHGLHEGHRPRTLDVRTFAPIRKEVP